MGSVAIGIILGKEWQKFMESYFGSRIKLEATGNLLGLAWQKASQVVRLLHEYKEI